MMTIERFAEEMKDRIVKGMGEGYGAKVEQITKNNGVEMTGIRVWKKGRNVSPTIYVDDFYREVERGLSLDEAGERAVATLKKGMPKDDLDLGFFKDYEGVKDRICFRLVNARENREMLEQVPHEMYLDLATVYFCPIEDKEIGQGTIPITNQHMEMWGVTKDDLKEAAVRNTQRLYPPSCVSLDEILAEMMGFAQKQEHGELPSCEADPLNPGGMHVLTNRERTFGASVLLYEDYLQRVSEAMESDLYVIPSSIHECMILPKTDEGNADDLARIIKEVNPTIDPREVLSDSLYQYDRETQSLSICRTVEQCEEQGNGQSSEMSMTL